MPSWSGRGWVSRNGTRLFETKYGVESVTAQSVAKTFGHTEVMDGLDDIFGQLDTDERQGWDLMQHPEGLRLHLQTGEVLQFVPRNGTGSIHGNKWE
jgi:hypothetical protein